MVTENEIREALREVIDPEVGINLVDMNLIKDIKVDGERVKVKMTLTIPTCPLSSYLTNQVKEKVESLPGVKSAEVELVDL